MKLKGKIVIFLMVVTIIVVIGILFSNYLLQSTGGAYDRSGCFFAVTTQDHEQQPQWYFVSDQNETIPWLFYSMDELKEFTGLSQIVFDYEDLPQAVRGFVENILSDYPKTIIPIYGINVAGDYPNKQQASWIVIFYDEYGNYSGWFGTIHYSHRYDTSTFPKYIYMTNARGYCFCGDGECPEPVRPETTPYCIEDEPWAITYKEEAKNALLNYLNENNIEGTIRYGLSISFLWKIKILGIENTGPVDIPPVKDVIVMNFY